MSRTLRLMVLFSGASIFALLIAITLHELGHVLAVYFLYGQISTIRFDSLASASVSYSVSHPQPFHQLLVSLAGIALGPLLGLAVFIAVWPSRSPWTVSLLMVGVTSLAANGFMSLVGVLFSCINDISRSIVLGTSKILLVLYGSFLLMMGLTLFLRIKPFLGFKKSDSLLDEIKIITGGLLPYVVGAIGYNMVYHPSMVEMNFCYCLVIIFVMTGVCFSRALNIGPREDINVVITWRHALFAVSICLAVIVILLGVHVNKS